ncbi:MAG: TonB-dependent receptor [Chitinophagales bacterium]
MVRLLSLFVLNLLFLGSQAQTALVRGKITDVPNGNPVNGALVRVKGTSDEAFSDTTGAFALRTAAGVIQLEVFSSSFPSPAVAPFSIVAGSETTLNIPMKGGTTEVPAPPAESKPIATEAVRNSPTETEVVPAQQIAAPPAPSKSSTTIVSNGKGSVVIKGKVTDERDGSAMIGVNVKIKGTSIGMSTDMDGAFRINANVGFVQLEATYLGYQTRMIDVLTVKEGEEKIVNIIMTDAAKQLDIVVVTGSKYEKKLGEEVSSMEVLKGQNLTQSSQTVNEAMNKVPGVNMLGKTISIRGGSGFADATSNRVMALLDEMPLISPENGGIRWATLPVEAIEQIELVKGASSAAYGSSALIGSLNIRTINPKKDEPFNKIYTNVGAYAPYQNPEWTWFYKRFKSGVKIPPVFGGVAYVHARKYGDVDVVFNGAYQGNQGYAYKLRSENARAFLKLKYTPHKFDRLTVGVNANFAYEKYDDFFLYQNYHADTLPSYLQIPGYRSGDSLLLFATHIKDSTDFTKSYSVNVDPYINFFDKKDGKHSLKVRFYHVTSNGTSGDTSKSNQIYAEYSYNRRFRDLDMNVSTGISGYYTKVNSVTFHNRMAANVGAYIQVEKRFFKRLIITAGVRLDYFKLDTTASRNELDFINWVGRRDSAHLITAPVKPLFRIGINYQPLEGTYIRASFGQGYRYPAIAEKFVQTPRSGAYAVPNFGLKPESGWSAELGIKQGVKVSRWVFYADLVGYINRYRNMIEFLSLTGPSPVPIPKEYEFAIKAQAKNYTKAQIWGVEVSAIGTGSIFGVPLNFLVGYTYMNPRNLNPDPKDSTSKYLNFRVEHAAKADIQTVYKGVIIGFTATITGPMRRIDPNYNLTGVYNWRKEHEGKTDVVLDARLGYNYKDIFTGTFIVKNFTNHAYTLRPGFVEPPVNFTLQLTYHWGQIFGKKKKDA